MTRDTGSTETAKLRESQAYMVFDALEWMTILGIQENEPEMAGHYYDVLCLLGEQMPAFRESYIEWVADAAEENDLHRRKGERFDECLAELEAWCRENDHAAAKWFDDGGTNKP